MLLIFSAALCFFHLFVFLLCRWSLFLITRLFNRSCPRFRINLLILYIRLMMCYVEEFEDTKGVIRIRKSWKGRQHNDQKKKDIRTKNNLQNITHKTKDRVTRIPLKTRGDLRCSGRVSSSCSTSDFILTNFRPSK